MKSITNTTKASKLSEKLSQIQTLKPLISFDDIKADDRDLKMVRRTESDTLEITSCINVVCAYAEITSLFYTYRHSMNYQNMQMFFQQDYISGDIPNFVEEKSILIRRSAFTDNDARYQWQYAESYLPNHENKILMITIYTLSNPSTSTQKETITDIVATYIIRELPDIVHTNADMTYNIMFTGNLLNLKTNGSKPSYSHLSKLATDIGIIPEIILKRRILSQQQVDLNKHRPTNNRCTNCLTSLLVVRFKYLFTDGKSMCCLCGYNICKSCMVEKIYSPSGSNKPIVICKNCLTRVQFCNFSNIDQEAKFDAIIQDQTGYDAGRNAFDYLVSKYRNDTKSFRFIISKMLNKDMTIFNSASDSIWTRELSKYLIEHPPLEKCHVSTMNDTKSYPLRALLGDDIEGYSPIPTNEKQRLAAVNTISIDKWSGNADLLKLCDLVAHDQCDVSMLIIIGSETELNVVASNNPAIIAKYPRRLSFCQYILMEGRPLLISNPESDIRFCKLRCLKEFMIKSYFGVPIIYDGQIVGTLCIMSPIFRHISRSQYSLMTKLAQTVSNILKDNQSATPAVS